MPSERKLVDFKKILNNMFENNANWLENQSLIYDKWF